MKSLQELKTTAREGLRLAKADPEIIEAVIYASSNRRTVGRLVYTSHFPCNGLEEPKSDDDFGVSVEVWTKKKGKGEKKKFGIGQETNDLSFDAIKRALEKAKRDAVPDKDFHGFLKPEQFPLKKKTIKAGYHDKELIDLPPNEEAKLLAKLSWETIQGATETIAVYAKKHNLTPRKLAFILNGDNFLLRERMALATTNGIFDSDETTASFSFVTAMLEKEQAKGSSWRARLKLDDDYSAYHIGKQATLGAINNIGGARIKGGKYRVIFGHQATTELFANLLLGHVNLGLVDFGASIFSGKYGQKVASDTLTMYDDASLPGGAGTKRITCEGCPTGKTRLIEKGVLVGYLSDSRTTNKVMNNRKRSKELLGVDPHEIRHAVSPQNGFRFGEGGGRIAGGIPGIHATNLIIESHKPLSEQDLIKEVKDGIFIGRLWYTYPVGGYSTGIISGTAVADNYVIKNGKLSRPILPNTLRIVDNIGEMIKKIIGIGGNQQPTILWASDEITHAPWIAIDDVNFVEIGKEN